MKLKEASKRQQNKNVKETRKLKVQEEKER